MVRGDLTGRRFGNLTVVKLNKQATNGLNYWDCVCRCGNTVVARGSYLKSGIQKSCGCNMIIQKETPPETVSIKVGEKVTFDPFESIMGFGSNDNRGNIVTGTVVFVNYQHDWFSVAYGKPELRASFRFDEIGKAVNVCG